MKQLTDYIISSHDRSEGREPIEWANFWYSETNSTPPRPRILLIGDSTARMVRSTFERVARRPVDMIGTSCGLNDVLFGKQMEAFFASEQFCYDCIFVQVGHHSIKNVHGEEYSEDDFRQFRKDYLGLLDFLQQYSNNIVLLTNFLNVSSLPKWASCKLKSLPILIYRKIVGEKIDWLWSATVQRKNEIILEIAKSKGYKFCDIDSLMRKDCQGCFPKYIHVDHIHYEPRAKVPIVLEYMKYI